jgi:hypothetical protein
VKKNNNINTVHASVNTHILVCWTVEKRPRHSELRNSNITTRRRHIPKAGNHSLLDCDVHMHAIAVSSGKFMREHDEQQP